MNYKFEDKISKILEYTSEDIVKLGNIIIADKEYEFISYNGSDYYIYYEEGNLKLEDIVKIYKDNVDNRFIFFFNDFNHQDEVISQYKSKALYKEINVLIETGTVVYLCDKKISINTNSEFDNFLEYNHSPLTSKVYSIKLVDLMELINREGNNLFKENVRQGISNLSRENRILISAFKESLIWGLYVELYEGFVNRVDLYDLIDNFTLDFIGTSMIKFSSFVEECKNNSEMYIVNSSQSFWYKHNGVTIVSTDVDGIEFKKKSISLNVDKIQIVNGAQTLSKWRSIIRELDRIKKDNIELFNHIDDSFINVLNKIKIKTIFIDASDLGPNSKRFISEVTLGLNTQVPVTATDIFIKSSRVLENLRSCLDKKKIVLARTGEVVDNVRTYAWKSILQSYYIYSLKPARARNLNLNDVNDNKTVSKVKELITSNEGDSFINFLRIENKVNIWWRRKDSLFNELIGDLRGKINDDTVFNSKVRNVKLLYANGLSLFKSYLVKKELILDIENSEDRVDDILDGYLIEMTHRFLHDIQGDEISQNTFKVNNFENLFEEEKIEHNDETAIDRIIADNLDDISSKFLTANILSKNSNYRFVKSYFDLKGINFENLRTITLNKDNKVTESFPFSSQAFLELCQTSSEGKSFKEFEESDFFKQLSVEYSLFIFGDKIEYKNINFMEELELAKKVYYNTVEAFKNQDEYMFPKESDELGFHIRPKAINKDDVIEFTKNNYITKRTFWCNKALLNEIINR